MECIYKISVIVPTYKPQNYLWTCLNSLKNQTFNKDDFEIIIILNGCRQPYDNQIKEYIKMQLFDYHVNYIQIDQGGVSNARNLALKNIQGEYITFVDDDDYVSSSYLYELYNISSRNIIGLSYTLAFNDRNNIYFPYHISEEYDKKSNLGKIKFYKSRRYFAGPCMKLIHRDIIGNRLFNIRFSNSEDSLFMFLISDKFKYVEYTNKNAIYYRRIRNSSATTVHRSIINKWNNAFKIIIEESKIFVFGIFKYNLFFYVTRILGAIKGALK